MALRITLKQIFKHKKHKMEIIFNVNNNWYLSSGAQVPEEVGKAITKRFPKTKALLYTCSKPEADHMKVQVKVNTNWLTRKCFGKTYVDNKKVHQIQIDKSQSTNVTFYISNSDIQVDYCIIDKNFYLSRETTKNERITVFKGNCNKCVEYILDSENLEKQREKYNKLFEKIPSIN
jgi:hypothetical protein